MNKEFYITQPRRRVLPSAPVRRTLRASLFSPRLTMNPIANTPAPPYYAVIFTSLRTAGDKGYAVTAERMVTLAQHQPGFLGVESAREGVGITVSYWSDMESIRAWKANAEHLDAQRRGRQEWYAAFKTRIAKVERDYTL